MNKLSFLSALLCSAAAVDASYGDATRPTVELSLAPPAKPFPEVADEISILNAKREALEKAGLEKVKAAFSGRAAASFVEAQATTGAPSVRVSAGVFNHADDSAARAEIDAISAQIDARETAFFNHVVADIAPRLRGAAGSSFLQQREQKSSDTLANANVRIASSPAWPTVASLALDMVHTAADSARVARLATLNEEAKALAR